MTFKISLSNRITDNKPNDLSLTKDELVKLLTTYSNKILTKKTAPAFIAGHFCGKKRITENLESRTLLTLDIDHCDIDLTALEAILEHSLTDYGYCAYSTASHNSKEPKIRIVLFFDFEILVDQYKTVATNFINSIPDIKNYIDIKASTTPGQLMFLPFKSNKDYKPWIKINDGDNIKTNDFLTPLDNIEIINNTTTINGTNNFDITVKQQPLDLTINEVIAYLKLYPKSSCNYDDWLEVGECLHHQFKGDEQGKTIWTEWSLKYKNSLNNIQNIPYKWNSFKTDRPKVKTFASIIKKVKTFKSKSKEVGITPLCNSKWVHTKGKKLLPLTTIENFQVLLNEYNINIYYDEILKECKVQLNNNIIDDQNSASTTILSMFELNNLKHSLVDRYIQLTALKNPKNTWKDLILSGSNVKSNNFNLLCESIEVEPEYEEIKRIYLKKWLLQMLHMTCLNEGKDFKSARMVLVFQGKGGIGKTSWFRSLVPKENSEYILEGHTLNVNDRANILKVIKHVFVEFGELAATFRKSDIEQLKSFITNAMDEVDIKFIPHPVKFRRRTVFFGSVNPQNFLQDPTGNSRFLVLPVLKCNARHGINMIDLYAELLEEAKLVSDYDLNQEELKRQEILNNEFENIDNLKEKFEDIFDITQKEQNIPYTATKTLEMLGFNISSIKKTHTNDMARILKDYGFKKSSKPNGWYLPPQKIDKNIL